MTVTPKFTDQDIKDLMVLLDAATKSIGINASHAVSRIATAIQTAIDEETERKEKSAQLSLLDAAE